MYIGQEYTCLFISTVESLQQSGRPFDVLNLIQSSQGQSHLL